MKLTSEDLQEKLNQQIMLIHSSIKVFDNWCHDEALRLATNLFNLLYDSKKQRKWQWSLLGHLKTKNTLQYYDSSLKIQPDAGIHSTYNWLINIFLWENTGVKAIPMLDENSNAKFVDFDTRRNWIIFIDKSWNKFTRWDIISFVRHKDWWSHIDGILSTKEFEFMKKESLWINVLTDGKRERIKKLEYMAIRQITHEILKTLDNKYTYSLEEKDPWYSVWWNASLWFIPNKKVHAVISVWKHEYSIPFF